jgi:hypothetical protein
VTLTSRKCRQTSLADGNGAAPMPMHLRGHARPVALATTIVVGR